MYCIISNHQISKSFQGQNAYKPVQFCILVDASIHIGHLCNPPSENPGYVPEYHLQFEGTNSYHYFRFVLSLNIGVVVVMEF